MSFCSIDILELIKDIRKITAISKVQCVCSSSSRYRKLLLCWCMYVEQFVVSKCLEVTFRFREFCGWRMEVEHQLTRYWFALEYMIHLVIY